MHDPSLVPFHCLVRQISPGVMKVNGLDVKSGVEGVLDEENRASSATGHVEPTSESVMVDTHRCFLSRHDMPPACDLLLTGMFLSASGSWIPVIDAESLLHKRTIRQFFVEAVCLRRYVVSPFRCSSKFFDGFFEHRPDVAPRKHQGLSLPV